MFSVSAITPSKSSSSARGGIVGEGLVGGRPPRRGMRPRRGGGHEADYRRDGPDRQIVDFPPWGPYGCVFAFARFRAPRAEHPAAILGGSVMARPVTLFTGQWADLTLEVICQKAS